MAGDCVSLIGDFFDCLYCHGIIFPFFMVHEVSKQECNGPRITFSGNLYKEI